MSPESGPESGTASGTAAAIFAEALADQRRARGDYGHSVESDLELPVSKLPGDVLESAILAAECARGGSCHNIGRARARLIRVISLALSAIQRIDGGTARLNAEPPALLAQMGVRG